MTRAMELSAPNMTLQVLMVVGLDAVRAGELSVGILEGDDGALRGAGTNSVHDSGIGCWQDRRRDQH